jgi:phosphate-selective porin OprO/OprP
MNASIIRLKKYLHVAVVAALVMPVLSLADNASDPDARVQQLEKMMQQMQQQRAEQDKQMQVMAEELKAMQQQMAQSKQSAMEEKKEAPVIMANEKDGIGFKSGSGDFSIKMHGLVQADYRNVDADYVNQATANTQYASGWMIRKARPWIEGTVFGWIDYRLTPEFATTTSNVATVTTGTSTPNGSVTLGTPEVIDAYFDAKFKPWLKLRVGKFKPFVGLARLQSDVDGKFIEQSLVTGNLLPTRDVGVALFGDLFNGKLNYAVGVSNGVIDGGDQSVALDVNNNKEITARLFAQPFMGDGSILAGLGFGLAATHNKQQGQNTNSSTSQLATYRSFSQLNFFSYATTAGAAAYADGQRDRWSPQAYYYYGPFGLMAEYAYERQEVTRSTNHRTLGNDAWQATFSYLLTGEEASYGGVKPKQPFSPNGNGWGAWEIVGRLSGMNIDDNAFIGTSTSVDKLSNIATSARSATAYGVGVNWYLNNYTRFTLDFEKTSFDGGAAGSTANTTAITNLVDKTGERAMIGRLQVAF